MARIALTAPVALVTLVAVGLCCASPGLAAPDEAPVVKRFRRATLPRFTPQDSAGIFFENVFSPDAATPRPGDAIKTPAAGSSLEAAGTGLPVAPPSRKSTARNKRKPRRKP